MVNNSDNAAVQLSEPVGEPSDTPVAVQFVLVVAFTVIGQLIVGFTLSVTITDCSQVLVLPEASVTVQVTIVVPNG